MEAKYWPNEWSQFIKTSNKFGPYEKRESVGPEEIKVGN